MSSLRRKPPKWTCRPPASVICDKYALLRRRSRAMEIDAAGNLRFFFCLSAPSLLFLFSFFLPPARTSGKKSACTREDFADDAPDVTALIRPLLRHSHKTGNRWYMGPPGTARVLQSGRDLMQATELRTPILIGVLCSPRARRVLMCAASWTAVTQPGRQRIQNKSEASRFPLGSLVDSPELRERCKVERTNKFCYLFTKEAIFQRFMRNNKNVGSLYHSGEIQKVLDSARCGR